MLAALAEVEMNAMQSSGNCVRNITADQFAGRARDEIEDPRPWCELIRQWSILHPEFSYLPRKFKIAVSGDPSDRAAVKLHDVGLYLRRNAAGVIGFEVIVGGGQGRLPFVGHTIREWLAKEDLLSYLEAILRIYNLGGRRDNPQKARIKVQVNALGPDEFRRLVDEEWDADQAKPAARRSPCGNRPDCGVLCRPRLGEAPGCHGRTCRPAQGRRRLRCLVPGQRGGTPGAGLRHRQPVPQGTGHCPGRSHGRARWTRWPTWPTASAWANCGCPIARTWCSRMSGRPTCTRSGRNCRRLSLATPNIGKLTDIIACPGLDFCALANARAIPVAQDIGRHFSDAAALQDIGELTINISGCMNACGHHHVGHIGILGVEKNGLEFYQLTLGGSSAEDASLGDRLGRSISAAEVPVAIEAIVARYKELRRADERFLDTYRRVGMEPFKEAVYGQSPQRRQAVA